MKSLPKYISYMASGIVASILFVYQPVQAAELEEIIVTAQKRAETLQEVPLAISALTAKTIERTDTHDLTGIALQVPSLNFSAFSPGQNVISMRGASSTDDGAGTDSSVAIFVDDVYLGRASNVNPEMFDLERIEVLRGPQGTLYGKNTLGGALNIVSSKPNQDEFEGKLRFTGGNYSRFNYAGSFSGPLNDKWSGKISFTDRERDGWVYNPTLNQNQKDENASGWRGQLLYEDGDLNVLLSADYNKLDVLDMGRVPLAADYNRNEEGANPAVFRGSYESICGNDDGSDCVAGTIDGYAKRTGSGISAKVTWTINDTFEFVSISAYRKSESDWNMDSTGAPALALIDDILDETSQFSQEFRLLGNISDFWDFVAGFWYLQERTDRSECFDLTLDSDCTETFAVPGVDADGDPTGNMVTADGSDYYRQDNETKSLALFANFNLNFTPQWQLSLGGRLTEEKKSIQNEAIAGTFVIINQTFNNERSETWNAFTPKVSVRYLPWDHTSFYLSIAQGFKSGGFAAAPQNDRETDPLDQEEAISVELGVKSEPLPNLRITGSLYTVEYEGLQIQVFGDGPLPDGSQCVRNTGDTRILALPEQSCFGVFSTFNAGDATASGLEVELTWLVSDQFTLSGFVSLTESEFGTTNISNAVSRTYAPESTVDNPVVVRTADYRDQDGRDLLRTPELQYGLNLEYITPFPNGSKLTFNFDYYFTDDERGGVTPYAIQYAYNLYDASVAWTNESESIKISLWGKNLGDEEYIAHLYAIATSVTGVYGEPRTYGVTGTFRF